MIQVIQRFLLLTSMVLLCGLAFLPQAGAHESEKSPSVSQTAQGAEQLSAAELVQKRCTTCHNTTRICNHLNIFDAQGWKETVDRMVEHGANVNAEQQQAIINYLAGPPKSFPDCAPQEGIAELGTFTTLLMLGHPLLMFLNICLALWILFLGLQRFRSSHLGQRAHFPWKTHVRFGYVVMTVFLLGMIAGPSMTAIFWGEVGASGTHFQNGLLMLPFILIGLFTGRHMDKNKGKRKALPIIHGLNNLLLVLLALCQLTTGAQMVFALLG